MDRLLSIPEAAVRLGISARSFTRRQREGLLPSPVRIGRLVRVRESDVDAVIAGTWHPQPNPNRKGHE